jgi:hypothetical protein
MTGAQYDAVAALIAAIGDGPANLFESSDGGTDVLILFDGDTRVLSVDAAGVASSGYIVPAAPSVAPGWDSGWTPP